MMGMETLSFVPLGEIRRIREAAVNTFQRCEILADIFRINTLYMIKNAGSGHIGSSFSAMEIVTWLWAEEMNDPNNPDNPDSDIFFSSKGHDVPGLYSVLIGLEKLPFEMIHKLRRLGGLPGHPDIGTPYIATNTGSLGMGVSKARGMVIAKRLKGNKGKIFVLTGDGELQEGQFWESLAQTANLGFSEITVIIDNNKIQSDTLVRDVNSLGNLNNKLTSFGWHVSDRLDGHNFHVLNDTFRGLDVMLPMPSILIADTIKGNGVSFMEGERGMKDGMYQFHSGAPSQENYKDAVSEILSRINKKLGKLGLGHLALERVNYDVLTKSGRTEQLIPAYGDELVSLAVENEDIVALDADLVKDTGLIPFKEEFSKRFIECGIAEQDMVSVAGGLALQGKLPIVHSFACFLSARANEQIYNNATEGKKIIYVGSLAGLIPAGPGHSHQSVRDIATMGSIPGMVCIQPCNEQETRAALHWAVYNTTGSTYIRLTSIPVVPEFSLDDDYEFVLGQGGTIFHIGFEGVIIAYGPVMLSQAVLAARLLSKKRIKVSVVNLPWLNCVDTEWFTNLAMTYNNIITVDDHLVNCGQGTMLASVMAKSIDASIMTLGLKSVPRCGKNDEVLSKHNLDAKSIASAVENFIH